MGTPRISVAGATCLVAAAGVGSAALLSPTAEVANGLFTFAGASLLFALLAVRYREGSRRAFWLGFAAFGWAYVLACYGPFVGPSVRARLLTTTLIDRLYARMNPALQETLEEIATRNPDWVRQKYRWHIRFDQEDDPDADSVALTAVGYRPTTESSIAFYPPPSCSNLVWFRKTGHAMATLCVALLGGLAVRYLEATRRAEPATTSPRRPSHEDAALGYAATDPTRGAMS